MARKRTKKEFTPYNDYEDRPFGLKWGTAFAMKELTNAIDDVKHQHTYEIEELPQMSRKEIDEVLQHAFLKSKVIEIQTNEYDDQDRHLPSIVGKFTGMADETYMYLEDDRVSWVDIRNVKIE